MNVPLKRGMVIRHQNHLFFVAEFSERHTGKQKPTVHVQLRDVRDGRQVDRTLDDLLPIEPVEFGHRTLQYLYPRGGSWVFMDSETFDEHELNAAQLHGGEPFLAEGEQYRVMFADQRPLMLEMPENVALHVTMTAPPERSVGTSGGVMKEATLENGLVVRVPLFIKERDLIRVDTRTRTYAGKEKEPAH
jgi:elongation factor P